MQDLQEAVGNTNGQGIHAVFEERTRAFPDAIAVVALEEAISYAELNRRANAVAHHLLERRLPRETVVGVLMQRSIAQIACIFGILKAGCAYTLLDPKQPEDRLNAIAAEAALKLVLVDGRGTHPALHGAELLAVPALLDGANTTASLENPSLPCSAADLGFVIFTSGSTGVPKGVLLEHGGVVLLMSKPNFVRLDASTVTLQLAAVSFDLAAFEVFSVLLNGGRLVLYERDAFEIDHLNQLILQHGINTLSLPAGLFDLWSHHLPLNSALTQILAVGDVLNPLAVARVYEKMPGLTLINGYGPTESTIFTACQVVPRGFDAGRPVPIGHPVEGTSVLVVADDGSPVAPGETGELWVTGQGLSRGYLNNQQLTEQKFVLRQEGAAVRRYYRTGDLVRVLKDGALEFVGRIDHQVKIRGFRVELDEVEVHLLNSDLVGAAVVLADEANGAAQLVAYVVAADQAASTHVHEQLRRHMAERLPDFMQPSRYQFMREFPLTNHGKVDRKALRNMKPETQAAAEAPLTLTERLVREVWLATLQIDPQELGVTTHFFAVGGDSLQAIRLTAMLNTQTGLKLPLPITTRFPTIQTIAAHIDAVRAA